jgi:hypothetical protein
MWLGYSCQITDLPHYLTLIDERQLTVLQPPYAEIVECLKMADHCRSLSGQVSTSFQSFQIESRLLQFAGKWICDFALT